MTAVVSPLVGLIGYTAYAVYWALPVSGPASWSKDRRDTRPES